MTPKEALEILGLSPNEQSLEAIDAAYRAKNDELDESIEIESVLREANTIMRMKRPMINMFVELKVIKGTHLTPLTPNLVIDPPDPLEGLPNPTKNQIQGNIMQNVVEVTEEIIRFLDDAIKFGPR